MDIPAQVSPGARFIPGTTNVQYHHTNTVYVLYIWPTPCHLELEAVALPPHLKDVVRCAFLRALCVADACLACVYTPGTDISQSKTDISQF